MNPNKLKNRNDFYRNNPCACFPSFADSCIRVNCRHKCFTGRFPLWETFIHPKATCFLQKILARDRSINWPHLLRVVQPIWSPEILELTGLISAAVARLATRVVAVPVQELPRFVWVIEYHGPKTLYITPRCGMNDVADYVLHVILILTAPLTTCQYHFDGLRQERRNSSALGMGLRPSCNIASI